MRALARKYRASPKKSVTSQRAMIAKILALAMQYDERDRASQARLEHIEKALAINFERIAQIQVELDALKRLSKPTSR